MGISDWSSDVCSSDLLSESGGQGNCLLAALSVDAATACEEQVLVICVNGGSLGSADVAIRLMPKRNEPTQTRRARPARPGAGDGKRSTRSEEHTSELPSLMRISYAVFCLKKKKAKSYHTRK